MFSGKRFGAVREQLRVTKATGNNEGEEISRRWKFDLQFEAYPPDVSL